MLQNIICEGIDRLGKSTLIENIQHRLGFFTVIHYQRPKSLGFYTNQVGTDLQAQRYQEDSFIEMFKLLGSDARIILDRAHLGEAVYSERYRGYKGDYVFELESVKNAVALSNTLLVLLVNNDPTLRLSDDGESFDWSKRDGEQADFIKAFMRSRIKHKLLINVGKDGEFLDANMIADAVVLAYKHPNSLTSLNIDDTSKL